MSSERGQSSVEWIAVVAVVAAVLLAAAGALPDPSFVGRAVAAAFERAFCLVSGGDCLSGRPRPCVVRSDERSRERRAAIVALRLADGRTVLREYRSDGSVAVAVEDTARAGASISVGPELSVGGRGVEAWAELAGDARGGSGRRFVVADAAAADRLIERLEDERSGAEAIVRGHGGDLVPDERWWAAGTGGEAQAALEALKLGGADAKLSGGTVAGVRERPRTGERTIVLRTGSELVAALTAPLARVGMAVPAHAAVELGFDSRGRPAALTVRAVRGVHGEVELGRWRSGGGDLVEAEARLDLADPVARRLAADLLSPRRMIGAARALGERLAERARVDVRLYETDRRSSTKGVSGGLFGRLGYEEEEIHRTARLVDAAGREPGLGWMRRLDCVEVS